MNAFSLQLKAPLMSGGDTGFGQLRPTGDFPSRAVAIGIIAAAMGLERDDTRLLDLHRELRVHLLELVRPSLLRDLQIVQAAENREGELLLQKRSRPKVNSTQTWRDYFSDAHYLVGIESDKPEIIREAISKLKTPRFVAYLGRRSCPPALPLLPEELSGSHLLDALVERALETGGKSLFPEKNLRLFWDDHRVPQSEKYRVQEVRQAFRQDRLVNLPRFFEKRPVKYLHVQLPEAAPSTEDSNKTYFDHAP